MDFASVSNSWAPQGVTRLLFASGLGNHSSLFKGRVINTIEVMAGAGLCIKCYDDA